MLSNVYPKTDKSIVNSQLLVLMRVDEGVRMLMLDLASGSIASHGGRNLDLIPTLKDIWTQVGIDRRGEYFRSDKKLEGKAPSMYNLGNGETSFSRASMLENGRI